MTLVKTKIITWHERNQRMLAQDNSLMVYLNVQLIGLHGGTHPALHNIFSTQEAKKLRVHLKFLTCDYPTNKKLSLLKLSTSENCCLCTGQHSETVEHVISLCRATSCVRERLYPELVNAIAKVQPQCRILTCPPPSNILTQFILDCTSLNLPEDVRIPSHNPFLYEIFRISRDWCFAINSERLRLLKLHGKN